MVIKEEFFTMSDGVRLYTRIVLPCEGKKFPIVFMRTPYEEARGGKPYSVENYKDDLFLKNGYVLIWQHVRGTGDSEGECRPYYERSDGLETLEIIRSLPFYNGEIYITGQSYLATVHLCYLDINPKDIKAAALSIQRDRMFEFYHHNGMCRSWCGLDWFLGMIKRTHPAVMDYEKALYRPYEKIMERVVGRDHKDYSDKLLNNTYNEFWQNQENDHSVDNLTIPVLFTEGWFDFYVEGMFSMWDRLPQETKEKSAFVVGPWGHATGVRYSEYAFENGDISPDYIVEFFNSVRDKQKYTRFELGKVNYYSVCGDFWTTDAKTNESMCLYFNSDNTLTDKVQKMGELCYEYNPDKPLGYYRHNNIFKAPEKGTNDGVLSFETEPFDRDIDFYGKIKWNMKVKSDCEDTAFFMRVYFVENGVAYNLTETITSLSNIIENYSPGEECVISILTPPVGFICKKGNSIRVDISSHSDRYVPHPNVNGHFAKVTDVKVAKNTVICCEDSYIQLPIKQK